MIWFWIIVGLLVLTVLIVLLRPLLRQAGHVDQGEGVVPLFRRQLADIDTELAQGRLAPQQALAARAELTRRMLTASAREAEEKPAPGSPAELSCRVGAAVGIAGLLPAAALAIYFVVGAPAAIDRPGAPAAAAKTGAHDIAELAAAADQLKERLQREPGHLDGWILLGRTSASLGRFENARDAYHRAIEMAPDRPVLHAELGEVLVLAAKGVVTPEAEAEFTKSADDPRARFYGAEAALQRGDSASAKNALQALLADAPQDAPWRKIVAARLAEISSSEQQIGANASAPAGEPPAGPSARDVAAAQSMSPEERQAMIRGMVNRLAARLEQNPDDKEGWARLAHAYEVLGDTEKAKVARDRAARADLPGAVPPAPAARAPPSGR
jgi:cytochrome c-type biogenesis protein CcmH